MTDLRQKIAAANREVLLRFNQARPRWVDVQPAGEILKGMTKETILHAGPPIAFERMCGPQRMGVLNAIVYEGLAETESEAEALIARNAVRIAPCHELGTTGGMAGITSASSPLAVVVDEASGAIGCSQLFQGPATGLQKREDYNREALNQWRWLDSVFGPALSRALLCSGGIDVRTLIAKSLTMGDECHNRNSAGSLLLLQELAAPLAATAVSSHLLKDVLHYLKVAEQFSLCIFMAAAKAMTLAVSDVPYSTVVTTLSRNGVDFGVRVAGMPNEWFVAAANPVHGLYFSSDWSDADAVLDMGDSAIMETVGLGGHVQAAAPALQQLVGGSFGRASSLTQEMGEITTGFLDDYRLPNLDFAAAPAGTDIRKVVATGITPVIDTAIAHRLGGVIGAGQTRAPFDCFAGALRRFAEIYQ